MSEGEITDSDTMSDISATSDIFVKNEATDLDEEPTPSISPAPVRVKSELTDDHEPTRAISSARKSSAIEVELELLRPMWSAAMRLENHEASEDQLQTLIAEKLVEVGKLIPLRAKSEKKFKDDCLMMCQIHENLTQILKTLQVKDQNDPSVRIEDYQAQLLIKDWETVRLPIFETDYQEASRFWFKPHADPLLHDFSSIMNKFAHLMAQFEYERSIRPAIRDQSAQDKVGGQGSKKDVQTRLETVLVTPKLIKPFLGDVTDPEVLTKFTKWKRSWLNLAQEIESLPGSNSTILLKKLKACLSGPALEMIQKYPSDAKTSYQLALQDLFDKYEDPSRIATLCVQKGTDPSPSDTEHVEAIRQSMSVLHNIRNVLESEKVDMFNFSVITSFINAMSPEMQAEWNKYKKEKQQAYERIRETAHEMDKALPKWIAGMVENYDHFNAWLSIQREEEKKKKRQGDHLPSSSESKLYCFVCGPRSFDHQLARCPVALQMSFNQWQDVCLQNSMCFKCTRFLEHGHKCSTKCRLCYGKRREVEHHILMCPYSKYRTGPLDEESPSASRSTSKRNHQGPMRPSNFSPLKSVKSSHYGAKYSYSGHERDALKRSTRDDYSTRFNRDRSSRSGRDRSPVWGSGSSR
ncbi:uncharacterized protein LOC131881760 [Tigriopus californicus]|uniref:uncharacterized protein LOC131881760 n=1 Tax=Tigriopus californicus TaxID=6832 RepID=UPI0027D9D6B9|nr:uncharacterized protein LOC131881760 [Tigriopus californicus]